MYHTALATNAALRDANLEGANLEGANLEGADLKGATMPNGQKYEDWLKSRGHGDERKHSVPS